MKADQRKSSTSEIFEKLPDALKGIKKNIINPIFGSENKIESGKKRKLPFSGTLLTGEQLALYAKGLAQKHAIKDGPAKEMLLKRLADNEEVLLQVHAQLTQAVNNQQNIVPAAEWLLDNFYLVEENIYTGKQHLPKGYSIALPFLGKGPSTGLPRIYDIAVEIISHSDGKVNLTNLTNFISSYQTVTNLNIGELWAIPIMLRIALIENLRRISLQLSSDIRSKNFANHWSDKLEEAAEKDPKTIVLVIADMARDNPPMDSAFVAEFTRRMQEKGTTFSLAINWLEQRLREEGLNNAQLILQDNKKQAADQVSISNSISSLRFLGNTEWRSFVEENSIIDIILHEDAVYKKMDFTTRDAYRHAIERIAKQSKLSEKEVAILAIKASAGSKDQEQTEKHYHVGYYLLGKGVYKIEKEAGIKLNAREGFLKFCGTIPGVLYLGGIIIITALVAWYLVNKIPHIHTGTWYYYIFILFAIIGSSQIAAAVINWMSTILAHPCLLPLMDFSKGVPDDCKTLVVVPVLTDNIAAISDMLQSLEVRFLANRDKNIYFSLLVDFKDAPQEHMPNDARLRQYVTDKLNALNKKYDRNQDTPFLLFFRPRLWNEKEKIWMGYERKRGKLEALNNLMLGKRDSDFNLIIGSKEIYQNIKYVITLDADTQLPREAAWKMIATMAHPLNRPVYNEKKKRITEGYTILQPRVSNSLPDENSSLYAQIHGNEPGTDPYTKATSDVYQDLFAEGSFIGKGIFDVATFHKVLDNRFPENRILSHDLLEGSYVRAGLVSNVQLYEAYPQDYITDMQRRHRWVRGDWQIASWVSPIIPGADKRMQANPISYLSAWKIFDNLRRSLVPIAYLFILVIGWLVFNNPLFWTMAVVGFIYLPSLINFIWQVIHQPKNSIFVQHLLFCYSSFKDSVIQNTITFICIPYEAVLNFHAIFVTVFRIYISKKKLLQWAAYSNQKGTEGRIDYTYKKMWLAPAVSLAVLVLLGLFAPMALLTTWPVLVAWALSPALMWWVSKPNKVEKAVLHFKQKEYLRILSRKIWSYFEDFVTEEENYLPPDNHQEEPVVRTAHRTSPTNIGMYLLSALAAYDFGYLNFDDLLERSENTFDSIEELEKYNGHLLNWYDTQSLQPLSPRYVSTVDSGNFIGHLITFKEGLRSIPNKRVIETTVFEGVLDGLEILNEQENTPKEIAGLIKFAKAHQAENVNDILKLKDFADELYNRFKNIYPDKEINVAGPWPAKVLKQLMQINLDLLNYFPWLFLPAPPEKFKELLPELPAVPTFIQLSKIEVSLLNKIMQHYAEDNTEAEIEWLNNYRASITAAAHRSKESLLRIKRLVNKAMEITQVEYHFLYDEEQHLLSIGFNVDEHRRDAGFYDLLASESRLTTYVAIAQGQLPQQSWFSLGRQLTSVGNSAILMSWSGSVFEYLMPLLVMPQYDNTLLSQTNEALIKKEIEYGRKKSTPWGISESGYNMVDAQLNYQYRAFGVPGIGLKRGLGEDLVIAPYATHMALMVAPEVAYDNLRYLKELGFEGDYGFYEAIDYTASRLTSKQKNKVIKSFMAHHQGMSMLSIHYVLTDKLMHQRFAANIQMQSALLLLQERVPRITSFYAPTVHEADASIKPGGNATLRILKTAYTDIPQIQLLSNGRYSVMISNAGGGYSRWNQTALTRWREDATKDNWGTFCYFRDLERDISWSNAEQPLLESPDNYEAVFSEGRAEFRRLDQQILTHTEVVVSPEDDVEIRRIHITNRSRKKRYLEVTSYAEVVLSPAAADLAHPAFNKLFIQTELIKHRQAILCTRRKRNAEENNPCMFHLMKLHSKESSSISYETSREKFIGRGRNIHNPIFLKESDPLSNSSGSVLDPIVAIQYRFYLEPNETVNVDLVYGVAENTDVAQTLIEKYQDKAIANRGLELSWTHSQLILKQINASESDAQLFNRLASSILYPNNNLRTDTATILKNHKGQPGLWSYSISGDLPIVLLQIEDAANMELVKKMVQAHAYWNLKGLIVDLVIWNDDHGGYRQALNDKIHNMVSAGMLANQKDKPGGIFIRSSDQITNEDRILFKSIAHIIISDAAGTLEEQVNRSLKTKNTIPLFKPAKFFPSLEVSTKLPIALPGGLEFYNGIGGFTEDGHEYVIHTNEAQRSPSPWINVLANPNFGTLVSESGMSYSWVLNAHELRLTPWNNDPVSDLNGEAFYIRDEESGMFWSPTGLPTTGNGKYTTKHGFGYSIFEFFTDGIASTLTMFVDKEEPLKYILIKLKNNSGRARKFSLTGYMEWVLGVDKSKSQMHSFTEFDSSNQALLARNNFIPEFQNRVAFFATDAKDITYTCDRTEFLGRNGQLANPEAMNRARLSGRTGAALDPCAALQVSFDLADEEEKEICFRLGAGTDYNHALMVMQKTIGLNAVHEALENVKQFWREALFSVQIETPDKATNFLANGWLNYQTIVCRLMGRSGFYQSGGAFGFRDQLQDVLSIMHNKPELVREQILLNASRQFIEGDVQHWWHPPTGRGVRTTCSDDYLWLPFVTARYVQTTGDTEILKEEVLFLEGRLLNDGEESYFDLPIRSDQRASLYEHCKRAINFGFKFGVHGLPLMGSGDWNDGMDKVGEHGKGESVWLGFFLYEVLTNFESLAQQQNDAAFENICKQQAIKLKENINKNAWDGAWYRRAYFDDGTPLGSQENDECQIDSIAQSWSVLSGGAEDERAEQALQSAAERLVNEKDGYIQLFTPPFDDGVLNPGYIKGYVPGVRENGGQYTHAAIWLVMAFAAKGHKDKTWQLLQMINPVNRGKSKENISVYKVEPYVIAADVYAVAGNEGRGGWTWYTGSAGWMYQLILNYFIGLRRRNEELHFEPCLPDEWETLKVTYQFKSSQYIITLKNEAAKNNSKVWKGEAAQNTDIITLEDNGHTNELTYYLK